MKANAPPTVCDQCKRMPHWERLRGPDQQVRLADGRMVLRRGQGWVCTRCGHTIPISFEAYS
ncbi:MAG: hypothetical protein E6I22_07095 [Chloroflexi bacterium]|nr:MAG: hypothetical protein E6I22_07095 [Chloroflexota bacterium]TMG38561.1 MAG: hypothetical protein E6H92_05730 [Chloroflexota bacterium]